MSPKSKLAESLAKRHAEILERWIEIQSPEGTRISAAEQQETLRASATIVEGLRKAAETENLDSLSGTGWDGVKEILTELSVARAKAGYTPSETATFIFSLKPAVYAALEKD